MKNQILAILMIFMPFSAYAQKITLGSCIMKDGGQYKGEMEGGKPNGRVAPFSKMVIPSREIMSKVNVKDMAYIHFLMVKNMKASGSRTNNMVVALTISPIIINMKVCGSVITNRDME